MIAPGMNTAPNTPAGPQPGPSSAPSQNPRKGPCFICNKMHQPMSCVDLKSEISIRVAIDGLRTSNFAFEPGFKETVKDRLKQRLKLIAGK